MESITGTFGTGSMITVELRFIQQRSFNFIQWEDDWEGGWGGRGLLKGTIAASA